MRKRQKAAGLAGGGGVSVCVCVCEPLTARPQCFFLNVTLHFPRLRRSFFFF